MKFYSLSGIHLSGGIIRQTWRIMKLTFIIITAFFLQVSASTLAQQVTLKQNRITLKNAFAEIRKQTGYIVLYQSEELDASKTMSLNLDHVTLKAAMNKLLENQDLEFTIEDQSIVIKKRGAASTQTQGQPNTNAPPVTVTGKVTDETGQPLPGVTVKIKTNGGATATDANGRFTISVPDDKTVLVFSSIGYESQELTAKDIPANSTITLKATNTALSEVQVLNKGYYFEKKELTTGSIGIVDSKTLSEQPVFDPLQALEGQVAGVNIQQNSGMPGSYSTIRIRGLNSIANGTAPLYIIDGVPYSSQSLGSPQLVTALGVGNVGAPTQKGIGSPVGQSPFSGLNLNDIENIEVLKDADATAIYGSRGANGVILITTKKGKAGDTKVNVDISQGMGQVGHFLDLLNTPQYLQMRQQFYRNSGQAIPSVATNPADNQWDINGVWDMTRYNNWQKVLIGNTSHTTRAQASISGGNANTQFLISGGYNRQTTVFPADFDDKTASMHFNLTHSSANQKFLIQLTASYSNDNNTIPNSDYTGAITLPPDAPALYTPDGAINWAMYNGTVTFGSNPAGSALTTSNAVSNNLISNLDLSYELLPGLILKSGFGYNHNEQNQNLLTQAIAYPPPYNTMASFRTSSFSATAVNTWNAEPQASYRRKIARGTLNILLGGTFQQTIQQNNTERTSGYATDALIVNPAAAPSGNISLFETYTQYRYTSVYARAGYDWDEKYLLNVTARRDGSTSFGPDRQFGNFGAIGAGWIFSKEKGVHDALPWLNFGKLRASYGTSGNDQLNYYQYLSTYSVNNTTYQGSIGLNPTALSNPEFAWEVVKKLEGGIDLGFLEDRIDLSVDYYHHRTGNQLVGYPLSSVTGFTTIQYNLPAVIQNTGLEVQLTTTNIKNKDFHWTTSVNFTLPNNKLIAYPGLASSSYKNAYIIGKSLFIRERVQYTGVNPQTGVFTFATTNANGVPSSPQELVATEPITQKYFGGIQNGFAYKNFSLDVFVQFVKQLGTSWLNNINGIGAPQTNMPTAILGAWAKPGDISNIGGINLSNSSALNTLKNSTGIYTDASFIRLKNVALSYHLPTAWQHSMHLSNARIYLQGQNLYTFTKYLGLDPETQGFGLPPLRVLMAGVSATF